MSITSSRHHSFISSSSTTESSTSLIAKLRRLKMQEKLLFNSINIKADSNNLESQLCDGFKRNILLIKLRKSYEEIKCLYDDIKDITNSKDVKDIDLDQVKKDVLSLESKIMNLKRFLHAEINNLKLREEDLMQEFLENRTINESKPKKLILNKIKTFNDIVPSPVKNIINTPHKYKEVQSLQDFIKNNGGKYGGWFEYNHNLFVQIRQKYIDGIPHDKTEYESVLELFVEDLRLRIIGIGSQKIRDHEKWYLQYLELENAQREALIKWKENRAQIRSAPLPKNKKDLTTPKNNLRRNCSAKLSYKASNSPNNEEDYLSTVVNLSFENQENESKQNHTTIMRRTKIFMKPTQVWNNRCLSFDELKSIENKITLENIPKFGIPKWRQNILNNE